MTAHDRPRRSVSVEPRTRLPIPSWMAAWPRGVQPAAAWASRRGVELLFRAPAERGFAWFRVIASLAPGRASGVDVRPIPGGVSEELTERLARAVDHHLSRSKDARAWLTGARARIDSLASLPAFAGELRDCIAAVSEIGMQDAEPELLGRIEQALAQAEQQLGGATAELEVVLWLACGVVARALDAWARHGDVIEDRRDHAALMCAAIVHGYLGDVARAQACARELALRGRDPVDARHAGELLDWVGCPQLAVEQLEIAASDVDGDGGSFDAWRRLANAAVAARRVEPLRRAAMAMCETAQGSEQRREAAAMQREAGEFAAAEVTLEQLLREQPDDGEGLQMLATLRLWRGEHRGAEQLAFARLARSPGDPVALRTLGAAKFLAGELEAGLKHVTAALSIDERDDEARLWRARILDAQGQYREAREEAAKVSLGDHVAWQLLRALVEEHATPGYRIELNTWFIVEQNIRQLLGDDAPVDSKANHDVAVAAIDAALSRLGGNFSARLTTPTRAGSLRWLDEVESPRHRSEQLQFQATFRPIDDVLADFERLAEVHADVPFFTTYSAELLLWRGEYERSLEQFERVWYETRTRWGYVGAGAAAMLLGRDERALALWEEGKAYYTYIDAEATYCYRGELLLRRGELELAREDLELAVRARPARLGAWIDLALLHGAQGSEGPMREAAARVEQLCPAFAWLVRHELGLAAVMQSWQLDALTSWLERLRERMRGNRSSVMYSMVDMDPDDEELLRVIPVAPQQVWRERARRALALIEGEWLSQLATR